MANFIFPARNKFDTFLLILYAKHIKGLEVIR